LGRINSILTLSGLAELTLVCASTGDNRHNGASIPDEEDHLGSRYVSQGRTTQDDSIIIGLHVNYEINKCKYTARQRSTLPNSVCHSADLVKVSRVLTWPLSQLLNTGLASGSADQRIGIMYMGRPHRILYSRFKQIYRIQSMNSRNIDYYFARHSWRTCHTLYYGNASSNAYKVINTGSVDCP